MRKTKEIVIEDGRDKGKKFKITEMPPYQMDRWATRALLALGKNHKGGILAIASMNPKDLLDAFSEADPDTIEPLSQELLECCSFVKDGTSITLTKEYIDNIIEEWKTLSKLRWEALQLNIGFLEEGDGSDIK